MKRRHFADDIFKCILLNKNILISINKILMEFILKLKVRINNTQALVQIMVWHRAGDKPLFEQMMAISLTHMCLTRLQ